MKTFEWEIGTVPQGWHRDRGVPCIVNGDFSGGSMAAVCPPFALLPGDEAAASPLCCYQFHYTQRHKVQAWIDWFVKEWDEPA